MCRDRGAGERSLFVAEKLRFHELGRNRGAVQRNERAASARAFLVQCARDQFFAGSRFTPNANARFARGHVVDLGHHLAHRRAGPNDLVPAQPPLQIAIFLFEIARAAARCRP